MSILSAMCSGSMRAQLRPEFAILLGDELVGVEEKRRGEEGGSQREKE